VEISLSGSGEGPGRVTAPGYSTTLSEPASTSPAATRSRFASSPSFGDTPSNSQRAASPVYPARILGLRTIPSIGGPRPGSAHSRTTSKPKRS